MPAVWGLQALAASTSPTSSSAIQTRATTSSSTALNALQIGISDACVYLVAYALVKKMHKTLFQATAVSAMNRNALGGSRCTTDATHTHSQHIVSAHPSYSSHATSRDGRRVSERIARIFDKPPAPAEPWVFGLIDEEALEAANGGAQRVLEGGR
ncbi:hypothetical protein R3P38DRAFT_3168302 [Favolaschia claudopus]|uniref:Uncharacterized protein n=1 Tax=Favolaschia claudopus TaxID=2862362 RepID=A0AAW0E4I9_9AGAR